VDIQKVFEMISAEAAFDHLKESEQEETGEVERDARFQPIKARYWLYGFIRI